MIIFAARNVGSLVALIRDEKSCATVSAMNLPEARKLRLELDEAIKAAEKEEKKPTTKNSILWLESNTKPQ